MCGFTCTLCGRPRKNVCRYTDQLIDHELAFAGCLEQHIRKFFQRQPWPPQPALAPAPPAQEQEQPGSGAEQDPPAEQERRDPHPQQSQLQRDEPPPAQQAPDGRTQLLPQYVPAAVASPLTPDPQHAANTACQQPDPSVHLPGALPCASPVAVAPQPSVTPSRRASTRARRTSTRLLDV